MKDRQLDDYETELLDLKQGVVFDTSGEVIELSPEKMQEIEELEFKFNKLKEGQGVSDNGN